MGDLGLYAAVHFFHTEAEVFFFSLGEGSYPGWACLEAIFSALFFAPSVVQLLDGERLTADDPLSSRQ